MFHIHVSDTLCLLMSTGPIVVMGLFYLYFSYMFVGVENKNPTIQFYLIVLSSFGESKGSFQVHLKMCFT